jgi:predicted ribosome quality control (RQC) complex YloA/Tae2 family protein
MKGIYDHLINQYGNARKEPNLYQMITNLQNQIDKLEARLDSIMNDIETLREENVETTNVLYEIQNSIEAVDRRIDIMAEDSLKVTERDDGSLDIYWDPNDPKYSFLNTLTEAEQHEFFIKAITEALKKYGN